MKKINYKYIAILVFVLFISLATSVLANTCNPQTGKITNTDTGKDTSTICYTPLEPNAFSTINTTSSYSNLSSFLSEVFDFGIAAAIVLALIMIIVGGIEYMTTDSWNGKEDGKKKITDALIGLGIALISWLLLYLINPNLVDFKNNAFLNVTPVKTTTTSSGSQKANDTTTNASTHAKDTGVVNGTRVDAESL
jgi:hypothetical protein